MENPNQGDLGDDLSEQGQSSRLSENQGAKSEFYLGKSEGQSLEDVKVRGPMVTLALFPSEGDLLWRALAMTTRLFGKIRQTNSDARGPKGRATSLKETAMRHESILLKQRNNRLQSGTFKYPSQEGLLDL